MQKIKPALLISLLLACACPVWSSQIIEQHSYLHHFGAKTTLMQWQRLAGNPQQIRAEHGGEVDLTAMDQSFGSRSWQVEDPVRETGLRVERIRNWLQFSGIFHGKQIEKTKTIDESPWFQTLSISLRPFLQSSAEQIKFWTIRPDTLGVHKLKATKKGLERLRIGQDFFDCHKVEIRLAGLAAPFWRAHYWYNAENGVFIRYLGPGGLPGTPDIIVEIESDQQVRALPNEESPES